MPSSPLIPRILLGAAVLLSVAAGVKSYSSKEAVSNARTETQTVKTAAEAQEAKSKKAVEEAKVEVATATKAKAEMEQKLAANTSDLNKSKADLEEVNKQLQVKDTELADLRKKVDDAKPVAAAEATPDPALLQKIADAEVKVKEQEALLKAAQSKAESAEQRATSLEADAALRAKNALRPGLEGRILVVNPNWNFVVLNIGDRQGVVSGASLVVKRGGSLIGRVKITSVEPSTSIADIQPGTSKGLSVQPGDVVIFPGS